MTMSINRKIANVSIMLMVVSIFTHGLSFIKEIIVAKYFGVSSMMDAFYVALSVPNLINNPILSTVSLVFIPFFVSYKIKKSVEMNRIAAVLINWIMAGAIVVTVFVLFLAGPIIRLSFHGLSPATADSAVAMLRPLSFIIIFLLLTGILTSILNAFEQFFWPVISQAFITISTVALIVCCTGWGVYALVWGMLLGVIIQTGCLFAVAYKKGFRYEPAFSSQHAEIKEIVSSAKIIFIAGFIGQLNFFISQIMASYLSPGSISALNYANKVIQVPLLIFSFSIATAVFPFLAMQATENKMDEMGGSLARSIRMVAFLYIPLTLMIILLRRPIIECMFQRGEFGVEATSLTSATMAALALQFFPHTVGMIAGRAVLALKNFTFMLKLSIIGLIVNVCLSFLFLKLVNPPVAGLALATSCTHGMSVIILFFVIGKKLGTVNIRYMNSGLLRIAACALFAGIVVYSATAAAAQARLIDNFYMNKLAGMAFGFISGIIGFLTAARLMNLDEIRSLANIIKDKLNRTTVG